MARRGLLMQSVGERLLTSKLQILTGAGNRRPSVALSILTGRVAENLQLVEHLSVIDDVAPVSMTSHRLPRQFAARTVYLSQGHLTDIDRIIEVLSRQQVAPRRLTRSAVLRRAVEHLRVVIEADPANFLLEND